MTTLHLRKSKLPPSRGCQLIPMHGARFGLAAVMSLLLASSELGNSAPAAIQSINPSEGPIAGGTQVTLTGSGFTLTTLTLDDVTIKPQSASDTQIVFVTPARDSGIASVKLSGNGPNVYAEFLFLPPALKNLLPGYITTVMGIGHFEGDGRPAKNAWVDSGSPLAMAADGSLYFTEPNADVIRRIRNDGIVERFAGTGEISAPFGDGGPAEKAHLAHPRGLAFDSGGNFYFSDCIGLNSIRRIDAKTGIVTTIAGSSTAGFSGDGGPASNAVFNDPIQIAIDAMGNLYILDRGNVRIRKMDTAGTITTIAGSGSVGYSGDGGPATNATFNVGESDAGGLAADSSGNVFLADTVNGVVRRIDGGTAIITTFFAGAGLVTAVTTDAVGDVYVGINFFDSTSARIVKLSPDGHVLSSWGKGFNFSDDGVSAATAAFCSVNHIAIDLSGNILFSEDCSSRIRRINVSTGILDTVAGIGPHVIGETGSALATALNDPGTGLSVLPSGELLTAEGSNFRIRKVDAFSNVTDFAGNGFVSGAGSNDGVPALESPMYPLDVVQAQNGEILVVSTEGISYIDSSGIIHQLTNVNSYGFSGDGGPAGLAITDQPWDAAVDVANNVFIADTNNNRIRRVDRLTGIITTIAGSGGVNGVEGYGKGSYCGDGGLATQACLNTPYGVAVSSNGTLYIGENGERIRKVDPNGFITTFFVNGGGRLKLNQAGNLFMTPYRIEPNGHSFQFGQTASRFVGLGDGGPASKANFSGGLQDAGIATDSEGNLFFSDMANRRIRAIRFGAVIAEPGSTVSATAGTPQRVPVCNTFQVALQVTLMSPVGTPENGIRVDFAAPSSGPSCPFANGQLSYSVLTDINGHASVLCSANAKTGSYVVTATPLALGRSASFSLTNTPGKTPCPTPTILWQDNSTGERVIWFMNGTTHVGGVDFGHIPLEWRIASTGDFNGDGKTDIVWQDVSTGTCAVWLMNGTTVTGAVDIAHVPTQWQIAATADFNRDGKTDILWQNTATGERAIWLMNGTSYASGVSLGVVPTQWQIVGTGDFNGDGKTDILWQDTSTGAWGIWFMNDTSYASGVAFAPVPLQWRIAGTGDFNGVGQTDILWQNTSTGERAIWFMNGSAHSDTASLGTAPVQWEMRNH